MIFKDNKNYNILKWVVILALPALATLIITIFELWGIPYGTQIAATVTALNAFLGAITGISSAKYQAANNKNDGTLFVADDSVYAEFETDPSEMGDKVNLEVKNV